MTAASPRNLRSLAAGLAGLLSLPLLACSSSPRSAATSLPSATTSPHSATTPRPAFSFWNRRATLVLEADGWVEVRESVQVERVPVTQYLP